MVEVDIVLAEVPQNRLCTADSRSAVDADTDHEPEIVEQNAIYAVEAYFDVLHSPSSKWTHPLQNILVDDHTRLRPRLEGDISSRRNLAWTMVDG